MPVGLDQEPHMEVARGSEEDERVISDGFPEPRSCKLKLGISVRQDLGR